MRQSPGEKILELTHRLNRWRHEYYNLNAPTVSDEVYDRCLDELERMELETGCLMGNSPTQTVGYTVVDGLEKTAHPIPLLSLEKTKQSADLMRFIGSQQVMLMHKLDGLTLKLEYENGRLLRASTRGDGNEGEVITHNAPAIEGIPVEIKYKSKLIVVGEAYIPKPSFERLRETLLDSSGNPYKNARNMAAGSIRCFDAGACAKRGLVFSPFGVQEGFSEDPQTAVSKFAKLMMLRILGFLPCKFFLLSANASERTVTDGIAELRQLAEDHGTPIDGIVVTYNDIPYALSCGRTGHHYKDGLAYKFEDELHETALQRIEWTPTRSGEISPVAVFDTVEIDGCEVSRASLHNLTFIKELELAPGCRILVSKRNMIIPHVEENLDRGGFDESLIPSVCPCCATPTRLDSSGAAETLYCDNPACSLRNLRKFVHFVGEKAMNIDGLSESALAKFISKGWLHDFTDIYRLDEHEWEIRNMTEGFGERSWQRLWDAIQRSRNTTFERFLVAMDIPMIGRSASRGLCRIFSGNLDALESAVDNSYDFTCLPDFGEVLHRNIHEWFRIEENRILWEELQTMLNIQNKDTATPATGNPFAGKTIVVTGTLQTFTRNSINARIESLGAKAVGSVSKNTHYLICGESAGGKLTKARELNIPILTEQQFLEMIQDA